MNRFYLRLALMATLALLIPPSAFATDNARGSQPFGTFDAVNNANLDVHFAVPVLVKNGRGIPFNLLQNFDSLIWEPLVVNGSTVWTPVDKWGWRGVTEALAGKVTYSTTQQTCSTDGKHYTT